MRAASGRAATTPRLIARKSSPRIDIIRPRRLKVAAKGKRRIKLTAPTLYRIGQSLRKALAANAGVAETSASLT
jgi:hypothetical protein